MSLAEELLAELKKDNHFPNSIYLDPQIAALCILLERHLANKIDRLPTRWADGTTRQVSAKPKRKERRME